MFIPKLLFLPLLVPALLGDLTPPAGPVTSTMKRLDEVEARTPISAPTTVVSAAGSYYLTQDLVMTGADAFGVRIDADDVTLDLNGFTIRGVGPEAGVRVYNPASNVVIRNGTIAGCGTGIWLFYSSGDHSRAIRIEDVIVTDSVNNGIFVLSADDVSVERCVVRGSGNDGLSVSGACEGVRITDGFFTDSTNYGIGMSLNPGNVSVERNVCSRNGIAGILVAGAAARGSVMDNRCFDNGDYGIYLGLNPNGVGVARNVSGGSGTSEYAFFGSTGAAPIAQITDASPSPLANIELP
jgi:nitrous oxidase accessory protein NosD